MVPLKFRIISIVFILIGLYSCGFAYEEKIIGRYYIIGVDTKEDLSIRYKLSNGDYIGKAPGQILQYGFNDTILVAKTQYNYSGHPSYFIINMRKDSEYAHEEDFRIGPLTEDEFNVKWKQMLNIQLKDAI